jgi:uncharacterized membrane protein|tara:strand:- start:279 stop:491 length:213 start_codon:yes stop_codon:yes gene_type:complete
MKFRETKRRSTTKTISWRIIAFLTSWFVLVLGFTDIPLWNAIIMNVLGTLFFFLHERVWNNINTGRYVEE